MKIATYSLYGPGKATAAHTRASLHSHHVLQTRETYGEGVQVVKPDFWKLILMNSNIMQKNANNIPRSERTVRDRTIKLVT